MMKEQLSNFIEIIDNAEDVINGGWKTWHEPEVIRVPVQRSGPASAQPSGGSPDSLEAIASEILNCSRCGLSAQRKTPVPGAGVINPVVMFIGEAPGAREDETGIPFAGESGPYLDKWLGAINLDREKDCFLGNIIKCRPSESRDPEAGEIAACRPFLHRQLDIIRPMIIVSLGRFASQVICESDQSIGSLRGSIHEYRGIPVIPTYHPNSVLRNSELRSAVWDDLKKIKELADEIRQRNR